MENNKSPKPKLAAYADIFASTDTLVKNELHETDNNNKVTMLNISELEPFPDHPFRVKDDEKMVELTESIKSDGILTPMLVRQKSDGIYQILSGHRRLHAARSIGLTSVPVIVKDADDNCATMIMISANKQRENLLPSELAKSYKMYYEAAEKKQGLRTDLVDGEKETVRDTIAKNMGISSTTLWRYIQLAGLMPDILDMVDNKKITFGTGYLLSYLKQEEQELLFNIISDNDISVKEAHAGKLKDSSLSKELTEGKINEILRYKKVQAPKAVKISYKKIKDSVPADMPQKEIENLIITLLKEHFRKEENNYVDTG